MNPLRLLFLAIAMAQIGLPANLAISTYLKDGFTPSAIASDSQGNIYLAGRAVVDAASQTTGAVVAKLDAKASQYLYLVYLDSAASDQVASIAIDGSGNAYIAGSTTNANFPVVAGGALGTPPAGSRDSRSFVTKLNPQGEVVFSVLIGGSAMSTARGIALTPQGQILVSGTAAGSGFPVTAGAYHAADSTDQWFLMELDAAADKVVFSSTGIGGSSIALDPSGNIYVAGSSTSTDYPTTPGAYQTTFVEGSYCFGFCQFSYPGNLQHVTKVDPSGSKLIYSTGLNDPAGRGGSTTNTGLAVDSAGNAYVTGTLFEGQYPLTVTAPTSYTGYTTTLDAAGAKLLFSIPAGGGGVQLDASGSVYIGGATTSVDPFVNIGLPPLAPVPVPPVFSSIPQACVPNYITAISEAYAMKIDPATGAVEDGQWIDGSTPGATGVTLSGGKVWITGATEAPDVPFTPGALASTNLGPGFLEGAYLSAVDFSGSAAAGPAIACVLDGGNLTHVGAVAAFQLISIFGSHLGPAAGVAAPDGSDPSVAGISVTFDGNPAQVLYVSASQINVDVTAPPPSQAVAALPVTTVMQVNVNGSTVQRQFPFTESNLNIFATLSPNQVSCPGGLVSSGVQPLASNADGSLNSCGNPARYGSTVSLYVHGAGASQLGFPPATQILGVQALVGSVDLSLPGQGQPCDTSSSGQGETYFQVTLSYNGVPAGP